MFFSNFPISYARWASTPIMYQQCNCNNGNNQWLNWWMMSEMVKNIGQMFRKPEKQPPIPYAYNPYQQYTQPYQTMYPYVNLNNTQQYPITEQDEGLRELQDAYKNCKTKFNFVKVNDKYIAIDKNNKRIKADTVEELMELIDAKVDGKGGVEHEGDETAELREEIESLREQVNTLEAEKEELEKAKEGKDGKEIVKPGQVPQGWKKDSNFLQYNLSVNNIKQPVFKHMLEESKKGNGDVAGCTTGHLEIYYKLRLDQDNSIKLKQALIDANPSIFDKDGKLLEGVDEQTLKTKLDLPSKEILMSEYGAKDNSPNRIEINGKDREYYIDYNKVSELDYIKQNSSDYFAHDPKHYTTYNLATALQEYDNTIGGMANKYDRALFGNNQKTGEKESVKDILKDSITVTTEGENLIVEVNYKGNGAGKTWHWTVTYTDGAKNGINKSMKEIYQDIIEGYYQDWTLL